MSQPGRPLKRRTREELKIRIREIVTDNANGVKFSRLFCLLVQDACLARFERPDANEIEMLIRGAEMSDLNILEYFYTGKWKGFVYATN